MCFRNSEAKSDHFMHPSLKVTSGSSQAGARWLELGESSSSMKDFDEADFWLMYVFGLKDSAKELLETSDF